MTEQTEPPVAPTHGKWPGVAGVAHDGDVLCPDCFRDAYGEEMYRRVMAEDVRPGEWSDAFEREHNPSPGMGFGAVLSTEEWDHGRPPCGAGAACLNGDGERPAVLDVRTITYGGDK